jgi:myo-inositol 2-dehydrogenase/D-chiro-inositol 1-dehydrogenase
MPTAIPTVKPTATKDELTHIVEALRSSMNPSVKKPGYGIIGAGMMGREHIRAVLQLDQAELIGLCDSHPKSLELGVDEVVRLGGKIPKTYAGATALAKDPDVDAILICTPNFTHRTVFDEVKASGKPIFLEKPMATTLDDALYLAREALSHPAPIQLGMQYRYKSQYQLAFSALERNELGSVKMISLCEYRPPFLPKVREWNKFSEYSGGTLVEKCCHYFDLMNRIAGAPPARVFASGGRAVNFANFEYEGKPSDIDDHALVVVDYENGVKAQFALNMFSKELFEALTVGGAKGTLHTEEHASFKPGRPSRSTIKIQTPDHPAYEGVDCTFPEDIELGGHYGSTLFEHQRFRDQLSGATNDGATCAEGLWAIITAWMAQASMQQGNVIDVREMLASVALDPYQDGLLPEVWKANDASL